MNEQDILNSLLNDEAPKKKSEKDILNELLGVEEKPQEPTQPTARAYSKTTRQPIDQATLDERNAQNAERSQEINNEINFAAYERRKADLAAKSKEKLRQQMQTQGQAQRTGSFAPAPILPKEYAEQNLSEREFARQQLEQRTGRQINREGFGNALGEFSEKVSQATQNIPLMPELAQFAGNLVAGAGQTIKAGTQAVNATQQPAQGQLTPWGAGPNLQMRAPDFTQAKKTATAAANQFSQAGESITAMLPKPVQNLIPKAKGQKGIMERKSRQRLEEAEKSLEFNLAEQDFEKRPDYQNLVNTAALKHSQNQPLTDEEKFAAQIEAKKGFSGFVTEAGQTLWMLATDERTQEEFGRASTLDLPAMIALGGPTGALAKSTTRLGLTALDKGIDLAQMQRFSRAAERAQALRQKLDDLKGQPAAAGIARQYEQQIAKIDKLLEAKKSKLLADMTKPLIAGKSAEEAAAFLASEGLIASSLDLGRQMQEGGELDAEAAGRAIALNLLTEAVIDAPSLSSIVANERAGASRDKQTQAALRGALDLGETPAGTDLDPRLEQAAAIDRTRGRSDLKKAGEIIGGERARGANAEQFADNKIVLDPQKAGGTIKLDREQANAQGYAELWDQSAQRQGITDPKQKIEFQIKGSTDSSGKINLAEGFNRTDYREEHLHTLQSRISKFRKGNQGKELDQDFAKEYAAHERNLQKYFARKGINPSQMSAMLDEQIAKDLVRGLDTTGEATLQYSSQIFENAPPMPAALRSKLENALGGRQVVKMPTARAAATATQVQPEDQAASEFSPKPTPEPAKPKQTKAEPTAQPTSEFSPDEDADPEGQAIEPTIQGAVSGKGGRAYSEDNTPLPYKWAVIDEGAVTASIGANATNQPRDRSRAASQQQIKDLSQRMNFKLASGSGESVGSGAPVLTKDGVILAGNGRIAGMGLGYESNSKAMAAYKADLQKSAKKYGIDPAQIQGLERPILVRVTGFDSQDTDNVKRWAKVSNQEGAAQYSPAELAKQDAESLNLGEFAAEYPLNHTANANFVRKFVSQIPAKDRAPLVDAKGQLSADGEKRLSRAVLAKAYGEHPIIAEMIEATDPEGTNLLNALKAAAPAIAQAGAKELADKALEAVQFLRNANTAGMSPEEYALQSDALKQQDPFVVALAQEFKDNARSYKKLAETLGELAERSTAAADEAVPDMMDLMGLAPSEPKGLAQHLADIQADRENATIDNIQGDGFRFSLIGLQLANPEQLAELAKAQDLESKGFTDYYIWANTGWFRAPWDNRWRFEVSDENFDFDAVSSMFGDKIKIKNHPLEGHNPVIKVEDLPAEGWNGAFSPRYKEITLNLARLQNSFKNTPQNLKENIKSTLLHELQHYIQEVEGFESGANSSEDQSQIGFKRSQALLSLYNRAKQIDAKAEGLFDQFDNDYNKIVMAISRGADSQYKKALEQFYLYDKILELAKNIQRADSNPLYIRKIGDPLTYEAQRITNWDQYYRRPRSGMFNRTFKSTAHKHAAYSEFFKNYNRLKFEELQKWAQLNNIQWFPESMIDLIAKGGGINKEGLAELKKKSQEDLKGFIKNYKLKGRENARNVMQEIKRINDGVSQISQLIDKIKADKITPYQAYLRAGGEYEARLVQARAKMSAEELKSSFPLNVNNGLLKRDFQLEDENKPLPFPFKKSVWDESREVRFSLETIQVDGKERPTKNSNGQPIAQTEEALKNFWRWFGDSKVVDEEGRPEPLYHGSSAKDDFNSFLNKGDYTGANSAKLGYFFTDNKTAASLYAGATSELLGNGNFEYQIKAIEQEYNDLENYLNENYDTLTQKELQEIRIKQNNLSNDFSLWRDLLDEAEHIERLEYKKNNDGYLPDEFSFLNVDTSKYRPRVFVAYLKAENPFVIENTGSYKDNSYSEAIKKAIENGHDSVIMFDAKDPYDQNNVIVFDPTQIKSATGNTGAFSPDNEDIRFSLAAPTDSKEFKNWFKDSKVVNEDGSPKVVYHGSAADFNVFDIKRAGKTHGLSEGTGFYFTENEGIAKGYVKDQEKGRLFEVYLSIQKPISYDQKPFTRAQMQKVLARIAELEAQEYGYSWQDTFLSNMVDTYSFKNPQAAAIEAAKSFDEATALDQIGSLEAMNIEESIINRAVFESLGYDGFKAQGFSNQGNPDQTIWVAMFPEQIKSATDNVGSFDPKNPDIRYSLTTETPEFKKWFDGSKIVDENGKPLVVYHGTTAQFTEFEEEFMGEASGQLDYGRGFYFTPDPDTAASFGQGEGSNLIPAFLSIKNPATNKDLETDEIQDILADDMGFTDAQDYLKEQGFDGIVWTHKGGQKEIVAFEPTQIKSAIGNRGTFDAGNPDIRFSLEPKWHKLDSKERKEYYDPENIRKSGKYQVFDFDDQKTIEFSNEEQEKKFLEKYPWSMISGPMAEEKTWFRYGNIPELNRSYNYSEQFAELGVSAYSTPKGSGGAAFFADRDVYSGKGKQVGWGSDGEPLIIPTGKWEKYNPETRYSLEDLRGVPHPDRPENFVDRSMDYLYASPMGKAYDRLYQALVDDFNPARRIEQQAGILDRRSAPKSNEAAEESAYVANQMRAGKVRDAIESAENLLRPIMKQLRKEGKTLEDAGEFLYAQHAPDYNREMAKINPPRERVQEILEQLMEGQEVETESETEPWLETLVADAQAWLEKNGERTEGTALEQASFDVDQKKLDRYLGTWRTQEQIDAGLSGMSTAEAKEIVKKGRQSRGLVALSQAIGQLRDKMRAEMIDSGLISFEQGQGLEKYPHYVPLKGWQDETIAESMEMAGRVSGGGIGSKGLSITGADIKRAGGRVTKASNPLGHFLADYQRTIERAQRNRVANKFFELAEKYPQGPWEVWEGGMQRADFVRKPKGSPAIAKLSSIPTPPSNTISFKRFGEPVHLQIRDKALLRAMKSLDAQDSNFIFKLFAKYNRVLGALITSLNPEFMITNAIRDLQFAVLRAGTDHDARTAAKTAKDYIPALAQILKSEMGKKTNPTPHTKRLERYWKEFKEEGTLTGYTITDKAPDALKKMQAELESGFKGDALRAFRAGARQIENLNTAIESMGRLAYYAALRDQGLSPKRAAYLAKNLTINFNRRGTAGQALNSWWLFFNAAIQGNAAFLRMAKTPKGVAAIGALAAAGLLTDLANGLFGPEDEERDMAEWDKKPMQERSTNLVIMRGKDESFDWRFPVGYGLNVPFTIGQIAGQAARRQDVTPEDAAIQTALAGINGFLPVRWTNNLVQTMTPTIGRIPVDMQVNQDFAGREIARTTGPWDTRPESQKGTDRQSVFSKNLAEFMNEATGGNDWQSGAIDPHPAQIDYVIKNSLGGLGALVGATMAVPQEITKNDLTAREVPFVRKVISQRSDYANQTDARKLGKAMGQIESRAKEDSTFAKQRPELVKLAEDYKDLTKQAKKAREEAKEQGTELDMKAQERFWAPFLRKARDLGVEP